MNLDVLSGVCCFIMAACIFYVLSASSAEHKVWPGLPASVRVFLFFAGCFSTLRATDFLSIADKPVPIGHINALGMAMSLSFTGLFICVTWHVYRLAMRSRQAVQLQHVTEALARDPTLMPITVTVSEVLEVERGFGWQIDDDVLH